MSKGFTLIELLVVTGIIVVISTVVLADNNRFGGVVLLENLAYDVALSVRQAQVFGISVKRFEQNAFATGYGVHLDLSNPDTYVLFADIANKGTFSPTDDAAEIVQTTAISTGYRIADLCFTPALGAPRCGADGMTKLDIVFKRPEPDAWISASSLSCISDTGSCGESARVVLRSPRGDNMSVIIYANGQISVQK